MTEYTAAVLERAGSIRIERRTPSKLRQAQVRVRLAFAGVCGTDLHYYRDFANAGFGLSAPVVLGHEATGTIVEIGEDVATLAVGDRVVIDPIMACGSCASCRRGTPNLCENKRYPGSATATPHIDGYFRELFEVEAACCHRVPVDADLSLLALVEPLACALHGVNRAGTMLGRRVLITGAGPIGTLAAAGARLAGAAEVVLTDIADEPLAIGALMGATQIANLLTQPVAQLVAEGGDFDISIEASGAAKAFGDCLTSVRRGGRVVQLGILPGEPASPLNRIMLRELSVVGSSQYVDEFGHALRMILEGHVDVRPMITHRFPVGAADEALQLAGDRTRAMKVQIVGEETDR